MTENKKVTKMDRYEQVLSYVAENAELTEFIKHEMELLKKKNSAKSDKPTKTQKENAVLMNAIYDAMEIGKQYTVTEINKTVEVAKELSANKVSALMRGLKLDGRVVRVEEKGKAYFRKV
jgi:hypothetical protein